MKKGNLIRINQMTPRLQTTLMIRQSTDDSKTDDPKTPEQQ